MGEEKFGIIKLKINLRNSWKNCFPPTKEEGNWNNNFLKEFKGIPTPKPSLS